MFLFAIYVGGWIKPTAQNQKAIIRRLTLARYPVEISFKLKGQPVNAREVVRREEGIRAQEFEADRDWLKDLTLRLKNTSGKTITYIVVNLAFPEVTKNGRTALDQIFLGVDPERKFQRPQLRLAPNEIIEISLAERYAGIKSLVETVANVPPENVSQVLVDFHAAFFDDGTYFQAGTMYKRDPDDPHKWTPIDNH
ncbi:MAG TPA: hypothetical protein VLA93_16755 [Pyrinomonadaceae bacterium]|nr:hypothetical protein [Pyrinomonadaceae bacterium]